MRSGTQSRRGNLILADPDHMLFSQLLRAFTAASYMHMTTSAEPFIGPEMKQRFISCNGVEFYDRVENGSRVRNRSGTE